jgi:hypothetical protein
VRGVFGQRAIEEVAQGGQPETENARRASGAIGVEAGLTENLLDRVAKFRAKRGRMQQKQARISPECGGQQRR